VNNTTVSLERFIGINPHYAVTIKLVSCHHDKLTVLVLVDDRVRPCGQHDTGKVIHV